MDGMDGMDGMDVPAPGLRDQAGGLNGYHVEKHSSPMRPWGRDPFIGKKRFLSRLELADVLPGA